MSYYIDRTVDAPFDATMEKVRNLLQGEGFGVLTEIDVKETLRKKLNVDFRRYHILGACNPPFAHQALQREPLIGTMLPCNVILQETDTGGTHVAAIDPLASMQAVDNPALKEIAETVRDRLKKVVDSL